MSGELVSSQMGTIAQLSPGTSLNILQCTGQSPAVTQNEPIQNVEKRPRAHERPVHRRIQLARAPAVLASAEDSAQSRLRRGHFHFLERSLAAEFSESRV